MDTAPFASDAFDPIAWINSCLRGDGLSRISADELASSALLSLQVKLLETNLELGDACSQALVNIPQIIRDIEGVRKNAEALRGNIAQFTTRIAQIEDRSARSVALLAQLDHVRTLMSTCSDAISQAVRLKSATKHMEDVFSNGDLQKISLAIQDISESLTVLKDIPEFSKDVARVARFQDRLTAMAKPPMLQCIKDGNAERMKEFVEIFGKIGKEDALVELYCTSLQHQLESHWYSHVNNGGGDKGSLNPISRWLPSFYDTLLSTLTKQMALVREAFPLSMQVQYKLVLGVLDHFHDPIQNRIGTELVHLLEVEDGDAADASHHRGAGAHDARGPLGALSVLISVHQHGNRLWSGMAGVLGIDQHNPGDKGAAVRHACASPLFTYQSEYPLHEARVCKSVIATLKKVDVKELASAVRHIDESVPMVMSHSELALERCLELTHGTQMKGLVESLTTFHLQYLQHVSDVLVSARVASGLHKGADAAKEGDVGVSGWSSLQAALNVLAIASKLAARMHSFDRHLRATLVGCVEALLDRPGQTPPSSHVLLSSNRELCDGIQAYATSVLHTAGSKVLDTSMQRLGSFSNAAQKFVYDVMFSFIKGKLQSLPSLDTWTTEGSASADARVHFSLGPSEYITQIGEHLLTLPQQLEPFTASHPEVLPEVVGEAGEEGQGGGVQAFAVQWLTAAAQGTMSLYLQRILDIPRITEHGAKQLATDIGYISNILSALGIETDETLMEVKFFLVAPADGYEEEVEKRDVSSSRISRRIAEMRDLSGT